VHGSRPIAGQRPAGARMLVRTGRRSSHVKEEKVGRSEDVQSRMGCRVRNRLAGLLDASVGERNNEVFFLRECGLY
jgi:hypothetical protein